MDTSFVCLYYCLLIKPGFTNQHLNQIYLISQTGCQIRHWTFITESPTTQCCLIIGWYCLMRVLKILSSICGLALSQCHVLYYHLMCQCQFVTNSKDQTLSKSQWEVTSVCSLADDWAGNTTFRLNGIQGRCFIVWSNMLEFVIPQIGTDGSLCSLITRHPSRDHFTWL